MQHAAAPDSPADAAPPPGLLDLPLTPILKFLSVVDLASAASVCSLLRAACADDTVWHAKALELYPAETVRLGERYASYRELVRDDNAAHAALLLPLRHLSCRYKMNRPSYFFECLVLALEWDRSTNVFRLYIDARGEADLRQPSQSSLGFLVHRGTAPDQVQLRQSLLAVQERARTLQLRLAAMQGLGTLPARLAVQHEVARCERRAAQLDAELSRPPEPAFADLLTVVRPAGQQLLVDRPGHKLGCLVFEGLERVDMLLQELPDSYASKAAAAQRGLDLAFCYANPIPVMPSNGLVDYSAACVVTVPPGASLAQAFRAAGRYALPGSLLQQLDGEDATARRQRWVDQLLPPAVLDRQPPWLV